MGLKYNPTNSHITLWTVERFCFRLKFTAFVLYQIKDESHIGFVSCLDKAHAVGIGQHNGTEFGSVYGFC